MVKREGERERVEEEINLRFWSVYYYFYDSEDEWCLEVF